jgi:hypothetical protein
LTVFLITAIAEAQIFTQITAGNIVSTRLNSVSASWIDADNDGDLDLFVSNASISQGNYLYRNLLKETGNVEFHRWIAGDLATPGPGSFGHSWADYDNDGDPDCYVAGRASSRLYRNEGDDRFTQISTGDIGIRDNRGFACAWGDYNNDSYVDLVIALPAGFNGLPFKSNHLFMNKGDGTFSKIDSGATPITSGQAPYTVPSWSDYDLDGDLDLFIGSGPANGSTGQDYLYRNLLVENGAEPFERITSGIIATTRRDGQVFNWVDYDNDRDLDVYITNYWGGLANGLPNEFYRNDGGNYTRITSGDIVTDESFSLASVWQDFDNDGDLDVYVTTEIGQNNFFYHNNGDGTFTSVTNSVVTNTNLSGTWGATAGDYDNDGDMDLFVPTLYRYGTTFRKNLLFRNDLPNGNSWINISCVGTLSNKAAIATRVHAKATINGNTVWQMREISTQNSFNGHNSLRVHFGFGDAIKIDELVFEWPSGVVDIMTDVDVNQFITVTESASLTKDPGSSDSENSALPKAFILHQNYPNPFNPTTTIRYALPADSRVFLKVYNAAGQEVRTLVNTTQSAGEKKIRWDGTNNRGEKVGSGIYLYKLETADFVRTRKMILMK